MSEDTSLTVYDAGSNGLAAHNGTNDAERKALIKQMCMAKEATDDEFKLFLAVANRLGLDPLVRQIYAIHRWDAAARRKVMTIQTGIDGFAAIATGTKVYAGADDVVYDAEDAEHPTKATVTVYRIVQGQRVPFTASARWREYAQTSTDKDSGEVKLTGKWAAMPYGMLGKCALAKALRMAFPSQLAGIYTDDEMGQADNPPPATIVEAQTRPAPTTQPARKPAPPAATAGASAPVVAMATAEQWDALKARMRTEAKIENVGQFKAFTLAATKREMGRDELPTLAEFDKLIAATNRAAAQLRTVARTARPADALTPSADEMAEGQADYDASQAANDFPADETASDVPGARDLRELPVPAIRP